MTAITSALQSAPIQRLKLTTNSLPAQLHHLQLDLENILNPGYNHRAYRAALQEHLDPEFQHSCIPWLGMSFPSSFDLFVTDPNSQPFTCMNCIQ